MRTLLAATAALILGATTAATPAAAAAPPALHPRSGTVALGTYLTGEQEVPKGKGDPDATGFALLQLHRDGRLCYAIRVRDVGGTIDAAHLHAGRPGRNGPVSVALTAPAWSGSWSGSVATCTQLDTELARRLREDPERYYVNVHSSAYPDGALRGQLHGG